MAAGMFPLILNANDFDCVRDRRFLERASIETGSAVLEDPDGIPTCQHKLSKRLLHPYALHDESPET